MKTNLTKKTIELTKTEMKSAMIYDTPEYKMLQEIRRDYPGFAIVEVKVNRTKRDFSDLDMKTIRAYVEKNGTDEQKQDFAFISKRGIDEDGEYHEAQSFFEIKKWFLGAFPEIKQQRNEYREKVLKIYERAGASVA